MTTHVHLVDSEGETSTEFDVDIEPDKNYILVRGSGGQSVYRIQENEPFVTIVIGATEITIDAPVSSAARKAKEDEEKAAAKAANSEDHKAKAEAK